VRTIKSKSFCEFIRFKKRFTESGFFDIAPDGSRVGEGLRDICAEALENAETIKIAVAKSEKIIPDFFIAVL
jgi:hypothetical protein